MVTGFRGCSLEAAVTSNSGDNNGYEVLPGRACVADGLDAVDSQSGTANNTTCGDVNADRHTFGGYGFSLPAGASIVGIEVRLDAWADSPTNSPGVCVELSRDNGVSWTAAKTGPVLSNSIATYILGSSTDTWGRSWASDDFDNGPFWVLLTDTAAKPDRDFHLDWVGVQVTYTP